MKKYICLILSLLMIMSSVSVVSLAASDSSDDFAYSALLSDLGIIDVPTDGNSKPISRGEFVQAVYNASHIEPMAKGYEMPYEDVDTSNKYYEGIYNIYAMGAISDSAIFRPDDAITANEALKIAVSVLGYNFLAKDLGGYPSGYVASANRLGLLSGVSTAEFTREDVYALLYNMLHCNMPGVNIKNDGNHEYFLKDSGTLLQERWNIDTMTGCIDEAQFFGTGYDNGVGEGKVGVDGVVFKNGGFDTDSLFGEYADVYYDKDSLTIKSVYAQSTDSKNITKIFSTQDIKYKNNTYTYIDEETYETKSFSISKNALIIYNGKKTKFDSSIMAPAHGSVKYIKNAGDGDVVIIKSYTETLAGAVVVSDFVVADKLNNGNPLKFDEETTKFYNQNGQGVKISSITEYDVLWIAKSLDGSQTEVLICSDAISGIFTGKSSASIYIDGRSYPVTDEAKALADKDFRIGDSIKACINPDGEIIWFVSDAESEALPVGYLVKSQMRVKGLSTQFAVKILGEDNVMHTYTFAPKFTVNGIGYTADEEGYNKLVKSPQIQSSMMQGIVLYSANKSGELTAINYADDVSGLPKGSMKLGLFKNAEINDLEDQYIQYQYEWGNIKSKSASRIFIPRGSLRFIVPNSEDAASAEEEDYKVEEMLYDGYLKDQIHKGYTRIEGEINSQYLVSCYSLSNNSESVSVSNPLCVVSNISQVINSEGIEVEKLEVKSYTGAVTNYYSEEIGFFSSMGLKFGDLVKVEADIKKVAKGVAIIYKAGEKTLANESSMGSSGYAEDYDKTVLNNNNGMGALADSVIVLGNVYASSGRAVQVLPLTYDPSEYGTTSMTLYGVNMYNTGVAMCDLEAEEIIPIDNGNLKTFKEFGSVCDIVVFEMGVGNCRCMYAYNLD